MCKTLVKKKNLFSDETVESFTDLIELLECSRSNVI